MSSHTAVKFTDCAMLDEIQQITSSDRLGSTYFKSSALTMGNMRDWRRHCCCVSRHGV